MSSSISPYKSIVQRLTIAENVEFHATTLREIETSMQAVPLFAPAFALYQRGFAALEKEYGRSAKSAETAEMVALDDRRDATLIHLFRRIDFHAKYPRDDVERAAAQALQFAADAYRDAHGKNYEAETAQIRNLITDLRTQGAALATLALENFIARLDEDNEAFAAHYINRITAKQGQRERGTLSALSARVNQQFDVLCQITNGLLLTQQDAATQAALEQVVSTIDAIVHAYKSLLNRRAGTQSARKTRTEGGTEESAETGAA
ncbi:MAG: DUF6261 family protein [Azoarcus sp.]|jgi:hypothetical protein|nr:DUF6261 family protein [Azoarcus sp.]